MVQFLFKVSVLKVWWFSMFDLREIVSWEAKRNFLLRGLVLGQGNFFLVAFISQAPLKWLLPLSYALDISFWLHSGLTLV